MKSPTQKIHLRLHDEFVSVLKSYEPSKHTVDTLKNMPLVLLVGPTAAGRNTLISLLVKTGRYHYMVSDTTRPKRVNNGIMEQNGVEYWFKTEQEFLDGLKSGEYIEAALIHDQQVSGANIAELEFAAKQHKIAINEVEVAGAEYYYRHKPDLVCVFLLPPDFDTWMGRIRGRGHVNTEELRRRLNSAKYEITHALENDFYHFVINHEIHEAATMVDELAKGNKGSGTDQTEARKHAEKLLASVKNHLDKQ